MGDGCCLKRRLEWSNVETRLNDALMSEVGIFFAQPPYIVKLYQSSHRFIARSGNFLGKARQIIRCWFEGLLGYL